MNWDRIEGNWKQFKGKVKEQWGKLTDDDIDVIAGKRDQLVGKIQEQYGITKDEAEKQVERFGGKLPRRRPAQIPVTGGHDEHSKTTDGAVRCGGALPGRRRDRRDRSKDARDQAIKTAEAQYKTDKAACDALNGNAKDICMEEAKGKEKVAKAEAEAAYEARRRRAKLRAWRVPTPPTKSPRKSATTWPATPRTSA